EPYAAAKGRLVEDLQTLIALCSGRADQEARLEQLQPLIERQIEVLSDSIAARRDHDVEAAASVLTQNHDEALMSDIKKLLLDFEASERDTLDSGSKWIGDVGHSTNIIIVLATIVSVLFLVAASVIILRDIAARRRAEEALAEEHNLLGTIIDTLPDQVFVKNVDGRFVMDNVAHRKFLGTKRLDDIEGKTVFDFFPHEMAEMYAEDDV